MKTIKSFEQKGWTVSLNETKNSKFNVELRRDDIKVDKSSDVVDYKTAGLIFDRFLSDLTSRVLNK